MRVEGLVAALVVVSSVTPGIAQEVGGGHLFPVVVNAQGLGQPPTTWQSDVTVHNPGDQSVTVGMQLFPEGQPNQLDPAFFGPRSLTVEVAPHGTVTVTDVVGQLGLGGVKGMLFVTCEQSFFPANPEDARIVATSRTYNTGSTLGTYGQAVPANGMLRNYFGSPSYVTGGFEDSRYRSNLGIANPTQGGGITVHYRIRRSAGATVAEGTLDVPAGSMGQWSFASLGVSPTTGPLTVELWLDAADVTPDPCQVARDGGEVTSFIGYVSKVDGNPDGTGDAEFILAVPTEIARCD